MYRRVRKHDTVRYEMPVRWVSWTATGASRDEKFKRGGRERWAQRRPLKNDDAPKSQPVADAYTALTDMHAGKRPMRTVVGIICGGRNKRRKTANHGLCFLGRAT